MANGTPDLSPEGLKTLVSQINEIDEKLDAASGGESVKRREILDAAIAENGDAVRKNVDKLFDLTMKQGPEVVAALYEILRTSLTDRLSTTVNEFVANQQAATATGDDSIDVNSLRDVRKEVMEKYRTLKKVLDVYSDQFPGFKEALAEITEPKKRGGGRPKGSTTSAAKKGVNFFVDDKKFTSFAQAASAATQGMDSVGRGTGKGPTVFLREQLKANNIKSSQNQPYESAPWGPIEVNGHKIRAEKEGAETAAVETPAETEAAAV